MSEIRAFSKRQKIKPASVLQMAAGLSGTDWERWEAGGGCSMRTAEKIRTWMVCREVKNEDAA